MLLCTIKTDKDEGVNVMGFGFRCSELPVGDLKGKVQCLVRRLMPEGFEVFWFFVGEFYHLLPPRVASQNIG